MDATVQAPEGERELLAQQHIVSCGSAICARPGSRISWCPECRSSNHSHCLSVACQCTVQDCCPRMLTAADMDHRMSTTTRRLSGIRDILERSDCLVTCFRSNKLLQQPAIQTSRATSILYRTLNSYRLPSQDHSCVQNQAPAPPTFIVRMFHYTGLLLRADRYQPGPAAAAAVRAQAPL